MTTFGLTPAQMVESTRKRIASYAEIERFARERRLRLEAMTRPIQKDTDNEQR